MDALLGSEINAFSKKNKKDFENWLLRHYAMN